MWGGDGGRGHRSLGTYDRKGWEIGEGVSKEVMAESHVQDLQELTRCRMGLGQKTKKRAFLAKGMSLNKSPAVAGSMANFEDPNPPIPCSI